MTPIAQAGAAAILALGAGAATVSVMRPDAPAVAIPAAPWAAGHALDGRVFETVDTVGDPGKVMTDTLRFADGRFQSERCQEYCDFGWSTYLTWYEGDTIHFTVTTTCPEAPHSVVWHGTVQGGTLRHEATWTTRRWYWTRHIAATGQGTEVPPAVGASEG
ncbi:hypothetical protein [Maliponia aquimaris]|uniref:Lipoprotein n=1 Tax=Maliponia aquimaris TaxID=1673631 RepID=A0A238K1J0_9RHOB|nr:hypothetical protein [Maliponia aquimaris]SMX36224.1 hypothetical protein MAA8898_00793 [Maliponia aquimaris]